MTTRDLLNRADAILRQARCDPLTGETMDRHYKRKKRAERKRATRHARLKAKQFGKLGPASAVRIVPVA